MASRAKARTPKATPTQVAAVIEWDGQQVTIHPGSATLREAWTAKDGLRRMGLPVDDEMLLTGALIWVAVRRDVDPDVTLGDVLDGITLADLGAAIDEGDSPEA